MQKLPSIQHPYLMLAIAGMVGLFVGFGVRLVLAQTFTDPGCDPTTNPSTCNVSPPLLLNPDHVTSATILAGDEQLIQTAIRLGDEAHPKQLNLFGNILLNDDTVSGSLVGVRTESSFSGLPITVSSANNYAISGTTLGTNFAGVFAGGGTDSPGLYATTSSTTKPAISAVNTLSTSGGLAATFTGGVNVTGNVNITSGTLTVGGVAVNPGSGTMGTTTTTAGPSATVTVNLKSDANIFNGHNYKANSITVMYADSSTNARTWIPLASDKVSYVECNASSQYISDLTLTNSQTFPVAYRIVVNYDPTIMICTGADSTPPTVVAIAGVTNNYWYGSPNNEVTGYSRTITLTTAATDNVAVTRVEYYAGTTLIGQSTAGGTWSTAVDTVALPLANSVVPWSTVACPNETTYAITAKAYDAEGNSGTLASPRTICVTNGQSRIPCQSNTCSSVTEHCCGGNTCYPLTTVCPGGTGT